MAPALDALAAVAVDQAPLCPGLRLRLPRSVALVKRLWGQGNRFLAMSLDRLAAVEIAQGRPADAEPLCRQALAIVLQVFGAKHPWAGEVNYTWGRLEIARKAPRDARPHLERAREVFDETLGGAHPQSIRALGDIASLDASPSLLAEGIALAKRAVELADAAFGDEHPEVARLLCILAALEAQQDDYADAAKCLDRAVKIRRQSLPASHPDLADALDAYAAACVKRRLRKTIAPTPCRTRRKKSATNTPRRTWRSSPLFRLSLQHPFNVVLRHPRTDGHEAAVDRQGRR